MILKVVRIVKLFFLHPMVFLKRAGSKIWLRMGVLDKNSKRFIKYNESTWSDWENNNASSSILFDYYPTAETEIARSYLLNILAKKYKSKIICYSIKNPHNRVWDKIYKSYNVSDHIYVKLSNKQRRISDEIYEEIIPKIKTKKDVYNLNIFGVWIGIDIYEEFLMRFTEPTVIINDYRLNSIIREGIEVLLFWKDYFEANEVKAIVSSHIGVRIEKNLVCKIAGQLFDIPFYSATARSMTYYPKPHLHHHEVAKRYLSYHDTFKKMQQDEQKAGLAWAKERLKKRFSGAVGVDMGYSTKSAFTSDTSKLPVLNNSHKVKVLIATHEFYDSPNCYGGLLFMDFYEWLIFLGEISKKVDYEFYVKTHPDVLPETEKIIDKIVKKYPTFQLIPPETSFHQLAAEGLKYVLTCYGSVGHECPLLGINVINAGNNPHMGYDFNWNPKTLNEYESLLMNLGKLKKDVDQNDIYEFYYIHHKGTGITDDLIYPSYKKMLNRLTEKDRIGSKSFSYFLDLITPEKHQKIIAKMTSFIDSRLYRISEM